MRKLKLRFIIPKEDESNVTGKFFKVFIEKMKPMDNIYINDGKLNIAVSFEETPTEIIQAISELPFQNVEYLGLENEEDKDDSPKDEDKTTSSEDVDPNQITIESLLKEESQKDSKKLSEAADVTDEATASEEKDKEEESTPVNAHNKRAYSRKSEEIDEVGAKVFRDEAKKSSSFEEFVENMGKTIKLTNTYKDFYLAVVEGACAVEEFSIPAISKYMEEHGNSITTTNRVSVSQKIKTTFEKVGSNVRFLAFFKEISKYKNYNFGDGSAETVEAEEPFKVLKEELVRTVKSSDDSDFTSKVGIILDVIRAENDLQFYNENREKFIQLVVQTAEKVTSGERLLDAFNQYGVLIFGGISHMAKAYLYQSIKNYCGSTETIEEGKIAGFFDDVIRLM